MEDKKRNKYEYDKQYNKEKYTRIPLSVPNAYADKVKAYAHKIGLPVNTFIKQAIDNEIARVSQKSPDCNTDAGSEF